ncbi:PRA1 family protein [Medicago truncatula]|uniref:PRA1 family protein n=1 Tax=Medicago truncatula TaxID=3880 RepID=G7LGK2_MEDTR|nr:PRA1 family protein [Medicago truncatula]
MIPLPNPTQPPVTKFPSIFNILSRRLTSLPSYLICSSPFAKSSHNPTLITNLLYLCVNYLVLIMFAFEVSLIVHPFSLLVLLEIIVMWPFFLSF